MPDVNVLVYAHRVDEAVHPAYRRWVDELVNGPDPFALSVLSAVGFVRIVTNRKIYPQPTPIAIALAAVDQIVAQPRCRLVAPGPSHGGTSPVSVAPRVPPGSWWRTRSTRRSPSPKATRG
jgi:uncharacterized protein